MDPTFRAMGVNLRWFQEEYSTNEINNYNRIFERNPNIQYYSIGSRTYSPTSRNLIYTQSKLFHHDKLVDTQNDGVVCLDESIEGVKILDLVHDHFDVIGLNGKIDEKVFRIYSEHFKQLNENENNIANFYKNQKNALLM